MIVSREYRAVVAPYVREHFRFRGRLGLAIWVVTTESWPSLRLRAWDRRPRRKGRPPAPWKTSVTLIAVRVTPVQHRIDCRPSSHRDILLLWHWRNMAYWRRWRVRENISFLRGEETEETTAATRRVIRLTIVNPQMDMRSKFTLSPAKGTAADARKNKGAFSRSLARHPVMINRLPFALLRASYMFSYVTFPCRCQ